MSEMISLENGSSRKFLHELSSEPVIYLRKWIGQVNEKLTKSDRLSRLTSFSRFCSSRLLSFSTQTGINVTFRESKNVLLFVFFLKIFVGIVNSNAVLFLWDQFFLVKWNPVYLEYTGKAILYLLRDCFFAANDYEQMRKVKRRKKSTKQNQTPRFSSGFYR